jgi:hypothetical protein
MKWNWQRNCSITSGQVELSGSPATSLGHLPGPPGAFRLEKGIRLMGIRVRATGIAIGVLLVVALARPAKADTYHATGQTDAALCAALSVACSNISYSFDFTTDQPSAPFGALEKVWSRGGAFSGEINGIPVFGSGISLLDSTLVYSGAPVADGQFYMTASGGLLASLFGGPDTAVPNSFPEPTGIPDVLIQIGTALDGSDQRALADWHIVNTPEPSTLLSLAIGLLGLMGLTLLKNRFS